MDQNPGKHVRQNFFYIESVSIMYYANYSHTSTELFIPPLRIGDLRIRKCCLAAITIAHTFVKVRTMPRTTQSEEPAISHPWGPHFFLKRSQGTHILQRVRMAYLIGLLYGWRIEISIVKIAQVLIFFES